MGARRNFREGGGKPTKGPHHGGKVAKRPPHDEKDTQNEKKHSQKAPIYEEKVAKRPPIWQQNFFLDFLGGGGRRSTLAPPLRASMAEYDQQRNK